MPNQTEGQIINLEENMFGYDPRDTGSARSIALALTDLGELLIGWNSIERFKSRGGMLRYNSVSSSFVVKALRMELHQWVIVQTSPDDVELMTRADARTAKMPIVSTALDALRKKGIATQHGNMGNPRTSATIGQQMYHKERSSSGRIKAVRKRG